MAWNGKRRLSIQWERAYHGHACWLGKEKLGVVRRVQQPGVPLCYAWQAGPCAGKTDTLKEAKILVEQTAALEQRQFSLF